MGLARWLGLDFGQLPLFATLKGNDLVLPADLADFQNKQIGKASSAVLIGNLFCFSL
jgi:hypothetical protein